MKRANLLACLSLAAVAACVPTASAATRPLWLGMEEPMVLGASPAVDLALSTRMKSAGVRFQRIAISWRAIAPTRPVDPSDMVGGDALNDVGQGAYRSSAVSTVDDALRAAADDRPTTGAGLEPLLVIEDAPDWAQNAGRPKCPTNKRDPNREYCRYPGSWNPKSDELALFVQALATRYDGTRMSFPLNHKLPKVVWFQAWNEPNLSTHLTPQHQGRRLVAPIIYKRILGSVRKGLAAAGRTDAKLVAAGLAPFGNPANVRDGSAPQEFARSTLCLKLVTVRRSKKLAKVDRCSPANFDVWAQHPYDIVGSPSREVDYDLRDGLLPDLPGIRSLLDAAVRLHTVAPAGRKGFWVTEFDWWTNPPNRIYGKSPSTVARWTAESLYLAWRSRVDALFWFRSRDVPGWPGGLWYASDYISSPVNWRSNKYLLPSQLTTEDVDSDKAKPALAAFRWPFVVAVGSRPLAWGIVPCRSAGVPVAVQKLVSRRWTTVVRGETSASGVFALGLPARGRGAGVWRTAIGAGAAECGGTSPSWTAKA